MTNGTPLVRVLLRGGVVSPADLLQVVELARRVGCEGLLPGVRQDLLFPVEGTSPDAVVEVLARSGLSAAVVDTTSPFFRAGANNIASSYLAVNVVETTGWLTEAVYQRIFEACGADPAMRVNFVDPLQGIVPLYHGDLNFIASSVDHYWHLSLRVPGGKGELLSAPRPIHTEELARVVRAVEERWPSPDDPTSDPEGWELHLRTILGGGAPAPVDSPAFAPRLHPSPEGPSSLGSLPCLEGFHSMASGQVWLGLYRRDGRFPLDFLKALCLLCQETLVGKIAITPWKSLLVKGIRARALPAWEKLLGEFGVNVRHSSLELNWHIPVLDSEALKAKRRIVFELDRRDATMHGLTFTLTSTPRDGYFTSVVLERSAGLSAGEVRFDVRAAASFDPNTLEYRMVARRVEEERLPDLLVELSARRSREEEPATVPEVSGARSDRTSDGAGSEGSDRWLGYQCGSCLTVYEERFGAPEVGIAPGTPFAGLSEEWSCPLCGAAREEYSLVATL